jgi:hypothetical protein
VLYGYTARNIGGERLAQRLFSVPTTARAAYTEADNGSQIHHVEIDAPISLVRVAIPFVAELATIEFQMMVPEQDRRYQDWIRKSAGEDRIGASAAKQHGQEGT